MAVTLDISRDYEVFDNKETVRFFFPGDDVGITLTDCLRRNIKSRDAEAATSFGRDTNTVTRQGSDGAYVSSDTRWHIPRLILDREPVLGCRLVDAREVTWTIVDVSKDDFDTRWGVRGRDLRISERFNSRFTIQRARLVEDRTGTPRPKWSDWKTGVLGRLTMSAIRDNNDPDIETQMVEMFAVIGEAIDFNPIREFRLIDEKNTVYNIESASQYDRLEFLPMLRVNEATIFHQG
jgi:hypothetical protein